MRAFIGGLVFIMVTGILGGCASNTGSTSAAPLAKQADKASEANACVMKSGGAEVLRLTAPADIKWVAKGGSLHFTAPQFEFFVWEISGAHTVDGAMGHVADQIKDQFKDFQAKHTSDLTIAGSPAKRMVGSGAEADDGDAGKADLIVFKVGDHVFVACIHGEVLSSAGQKAMLATVMTAQTP